MVLMALASQVETASGDLLTGEPQVVDQGTARNSAEALQRVAMLDRLMAASRRALAWVEAMQNTDGGWGAFDRDNDHEFL